MSLIQELPNEILHSIADALLLSSTPLLSHFRLSQSNLTSPSVSKPALSIPRQTLHSIKACSSTCRVLHAIFRPLVWNRVDISDVAGAVLPPPAPRSAFTDLNGRGCSSRRLFLHALSTFHSILERNSEISEYVRELRVVLPEDGLQPSKLNDEREQDYLEEEGEVGEISALLLSLSRQLRSLQKISLVSYHCAPQDLRLNFLSSDPQSTRNARASTPGSSRIIFDTLPLTLQTAIHSIMRLPSLSSIELKGIVLPPKMLLGLNGRLSDLALVAQCPMEVERLQSLDADAHAYASAGSSEEAANFMTDAVSTRSVALGSDDHHLHLAGLSSCITAGRLTTLHLGYCDTVFLRYITRVYGEAFVGLRELSLNVIERDLEVCQWFLDVACHAEGADSTNETQRSSLEVFDCTIRCNTALSSYHGPISLHVLDFRECGGLRRISLRYLLLSRFTESVRSAIVGNVRSALETRSTRGGPGNEGGDGKLESRGVEELNLVVDWAGDGDDILLDTFGEVDGVVKGAFTNGQHTRGLPGVMNLNNFTLEATHWPCVDGRSCAFRQAVAPPLRPLLQRTSTTPPLSFTPTVVSSTSQSPSSNTGLVGGHPRPVSVQCRRPLPLRTSSSPGESLCTAGSMRDAEDLEGNLEKFFPFMSGLGNRTWPQEDMQETFVFESRFVLGHRRDFGVGYV